MSTRFDARITAMNTWWGHKGAGAGALRMIA
jgi:hypothetical protein